MNSVRYALAGATVLALVPACAQGAEAPSNQQVAADENKMIAEPANPYAQAEMEMR